MCRQIRALAVPVALLLGPMALTDVVAQENVYSGGAVEGTQVKTNRDLFGKGEGAYAKLGSSELTVQLAPGDSDLFVYEFDAECYLINAGVNDYVSVQARLNDAVGFSSSFLQPQNFPTTDLEFCGTNAPHSVSKTWAIRLSNNTSSTFIYTFSIWWRAVDRDDDNGEVFGISATGRSRSRDTTDGSTLLPGLETTCSHAMRGRRRRSATRSPQRQNRHAAVAKPFLQLLDDPRLLDAERDRVRLTFGAVAAIDLPEPRRV